jgi:RND family efflux transporter MFP subunit
MNQEIFMKIRLFVPFFFLLLLAQSASAATMYEGIVIPSHEVELALPIEGVVAKVFVKEGDFINIGEHLLKLDDTLQKLEVERKKAIYEDRSEYDANRETLIILKSLLSSSRQLYEKTSSVSLTEVQNLEMQYYSLQGKINAHEARKKQELLEYEIAKEVLTRYALKSPINGRVTMIKREEGEWAKAGEMIVTAVDTSVCYAEFNVDERHSRALKKGKTVSLRVSEGDGAGVKKGVVVFVSPVADKASALVKVRIEFENTTGKVIPGVLGKIVSD